MSNGYDLVSTHFHQKFFRPSCRPVLNLRYAHSQFFLPFYEKTYEQIVVPHELTKNPEDTLLNYFSILREAENMRSRGCGTIGHARNPFPLAYNFLSADYRKTLSYEDYLNSFLGIGHTSLIKLARVPDGKKGIKYFFEIETIEGSSGKAAEYFCYSYGFLWLVYGDNGYRISKIQQFAQDFLCAPYHGWDHEGEDIVGIKYGYWCKLIKKQHQTIQNDYIKNIFFEGNDRADYHFIFFTLTNGTDVEIAQFRKVGNEKWKQVKMTPEEECLLRLYET